MNATPATRVLVVDDDPTFAQVVSEILMERGFHVVVTDDPDRAQAVAAEGCDAALLDLHMPRMTGLELARLLKVRDPDLQVMILTGFGDMESAVQGIQQGVFDFIGKTDLDIQRLERTVREAAARTRLTRTNRDLVARLTDSNARLVALQEASTALGSEAHQDRVLESLARAAKSLLGAATGRAVLFARGHSGDLVVAAAAGDGAETIVGARMRLGEGVGPAVAASGRAVSGADLARQPGYSRRADEMPTLLPGFVVAPLHHGAVQGALVAAGRQAPFAADDERLLTALAQQGGIALDNAGNQERFANFFTHASDMLITVLEQLDVWYRGHSRAVAALADMITRRLGMPDDERRDVHYGALLHDIGKVMVPGDVLRSSRKSTPEEMEALRKHSTSGMEILKPIMLWKDVLPIVHSHHEWWDGRGYPLGLSGEQIPLGARVIAVADAFDAMTRATPHRSSPKTGEQALNELEAGAGTQFDPRIVRLFLSEYRQHGHALPADQG